MLRVYSCQNLICCECDDLTLGVKLSGVFPNLHVDAVHLEGSRDTSQFLISWKLIHNTFRKWQSGVSEIVLVYVNKKNARVSAYA